MIGIEDISDPGDLNHISRELKKRVLEQLGLDETVPADLNGLRAVYAAWCQRVPFDNIRKMITLRSEGEGPLGGLEAQDFFEHWLEYGSGGTCWPSSNALYSLLVSLDFTARRVAGSMFDMGMVNHGSVIVTIDGKDWMVDTSILSNSPLPIGAEVYIHDDPAIPVEIEPLENLHMLWIDFMPVPVHVPCRLMEDPVDSNYYNERYEVFSRQMSPFNERLYFRRGGPGGVTVLLGNTLFTRTADGMAVREFSRDELCGHLLDQGVSSDLLGKWEVSGSLDSSLHPSTAPPPIEIAGVPPSRRAAA
jgi:N-hydroxyarylamine O-acetyltransferase